MDDDGSAFASTLGDVLRVARRRRGFTLEHVRAVSSDDFKPSSLAAYERGSRRISVERLRRLAEIYGTRADELLGTALQRFAEDGLEMSARRAGYGYSNPRTVRDPSASVGYESS